MIKWSSQKCDKNKKEKKWCERKIDLKIFLIHLMSSWLINLILLYFLQYQRFYWGFLSDHNRIQRLESRAAICPPHPPSPPSSPLPQTLNFLFGVEFFIFGCMALPQSWAAWLGCGAPCPLLPKEPQRSLLMLPCIYSADVRAEGTESCGSCRRTHGTFEDETLKECSAPLFLILLFFYWGGVKGCSRFPIWLHDCSRYRLSRFRRRPLLFDAGTCAASLRIVLVPSSNRVKKERDGTNTSCLFTRWASLAQKFN